MKEKINESRWMEFLIVFFVLLIFFLVLFALDFQMTAWIFLILAFFLVLLYWLVWRRDHALEHYKPDEKKS